jgi:hypothetical protein
MIQIYFLLILVVIVIVYLLLSDFFAPDKIIKKKFKSTTRKNISDTIKDGEKIHFSGSIEIVDEPLISPLSKKECALFSINILEKSSNDWESIINKDVITTYLIKNNNHYALIYSDNVECDISKDYEYKSNMFKSDNENLTYYLNQYGFNERNMLGIYKSFKAFEGVLKDGDLVAVLGKCEWQNAIDLGLPEKYGKILVIYSDDKVPVYLTNDTDIIIGKY